MKSTRSKIPPRTPARTPARTRNINNVDKDPVQVFCRLRPTDDNEKTCMRVVSQNVICVVSPENAVNYRSNVIKETQHVFKRVFIPDSMQQEVFECTARPLVEDLIRGKNGLLFTYGVTGSGKTYTMTGNQTSAGIMPRSINLIFNTISNYHADKFIFKGDGLNGFDIQSEIDALRDRQREIKERNIKLMKKALSDPSLGSVSDVELGKVLGIEEDNMYSVFISYVEIYNNGVYDLLEDTNQRCLQNKIIREDYMHNMFVHGVVEVEAKSPAEAFELFYKGQKRKRMAHTELNAESSRSHSIFTIRLVQAPVDQTGEYVIQNRDMINVSQLSLVDLAGSERSNRTNSTGVRLKEASSINTSLLTLRNCLEVLRENQMTGENKMVPYRESKLTHLFKNYFDGEGSVRMIVCVNPRVDDYDESIHVMKFAEMTQDVQVARQTPMKVDDNDLMKGRRKVNQLFKMAINHLTDENKPLAREEVDHRTVYDMGIPLPSLRLDDPEAEDLIKRLVSNLEFRINKRKELIQQFKVKQDEFRKELTDSDNSGTIARTEIKSLRAMLDQSKRETSNLEQRVLNLEAERHELLNQMEEKNLKLSLLESKLKEKDMLLNQANMEKQKQKLKYDNKLEAHHEKMSQELDQKLRHQREQLKNCIRDKEDKLRLVRKIILSDGTTSIVSSEIPEPQMVENKENNRFPYCTPKRMESRHRRSKSVGNDRWLEHRAALSAPLGTLMQPNMKKTKTLTKLTDSKYVTDNKVSKYCLISQEHDTDGEVETRVYKADILSTTGGGAQVIFNDLEKLKQVSPTGETNRKRSNPGTVDVASRCSVGIEGHNVSKRSKQ